MKQPATCHVCGRRSRPLPVEDREPDPYHLPRGWSCAPYPAGYRHRDGSTGNVYRCARCNRPGGGRQPVTDTLSTGN